MNVRTKTLVVDADDTPLEELNHKINDVITEGIATLEQVDKRKIMSVQVLPATTHYTRHGSHEMGDYGRTYDYVDRGFLIVITHHV